METSWTDDIPLCRAAGIGSANNEIYRKNGKRVEMHPMQDRYFHFSKEDLQLSIYGVFDGFGSAACADFAMKRMPADLLLDQLSDHSTDEAVRESLRQAFLNVERDYIESITDHITSHLVMKFDQSIQAQNDKLHRLEALLEVGTSATVAVMLNQRLFLANVGDTPAVICQLMPNGQVRALKLSVDHVLGNEDEDLRLAQLGLSPRGLELPNPGYTRCLGCHRFKGGYQDVPQVAEARDEPLLAEPEVQGAIPIDASYLFLLIFSRSITDCLSQLVSSGCGHLLSELCRITAEQFAENTTLTGVAQSVVDKIVRMHREQFEMESGSRSACTPREDMTLLIRNFHARLASGGRKKRSGNDLGMSLAGNDTLDMRHQSETLTSKELRPRPTRSSTTTESSEVAVVKTRDLPVDENGRIQPYVDFSHFNREYAKYKGQKSEDALVNGKSDPPS
eukprot:maker-scaffold172_size289735-snap-gene-1.25 protein:Tk06516 transcript:maker-scaffold172_size289735-snap-gene-1.25-mRNA-1 annotation:"tgf-beta-activated kinase 1 and map3k7-binding protein 1"